jgi:hypothetical protein
MTFVAHTPTPMDDIAEQNKIIMAEYIRSLKQQTQADQVRVQAQFDKDASGASQARSGGPKGRTGSKDHTRGLCAFVRPCTVGHKAQHQPTSKSGKGSKRTPM